MMKSKCDAQPSLTVINRLNFWFNTSTRLALPVVILDGAHDGLRRSEDEPAVIHEDGLLHREDGPTSHRRIKKPPQLPAE
jgi:hypothetical protein